MKSAWRTITSFWRAELLSPRHLVGWAICISACYGLAHLAGLREFSSILNGTVGSVGLGWKISAFLGLVYIFLYLGLVLLVPTFLLTATLLVLWRRFFPEPAALAQAHDEPATTSKDPLRHLALHNRSRR